MMFVVCHICQFDRFHAAKKTKACAELMHKLMVFPEKVQ